VTNGIPLYDATVHMTVRSEPVPEFRCCDTWVRSEAWSRIPSVCHTGMLRAHSEIVVEMHG